VPAPRWRLAAAVALAGAALLGFAAGRATGPASVARDDSAASSPARAGSGPTGAAEASAPGFVRAAAIAHAVYVPEVRHPVEVSADERGHLVAWLSKRLGTSLPAPDLAPQGFELVGGRLLPGDAGPSAQLMYQDARGLRVTLYVARRDGATPSDTAFRFGEVGAVSSFYWIDRDLGWVLSGELPRERLSQLATAVYRATEGLPAR
jgi:anti-sigma factor RsiW